MRNLDMWQTINLAIRRAMDDQAHRLNEDELGEQVDRLLLHQPTTGGKRLTTAYLLRRYRGALQRELCDGRRPRPLPALIDDQIRELTSVVMVAVQPHVGFSVEVAVWLAFVLRAGGLEIFCQAEPVAAWRSP